MSNGIRFLLQHVLCGAAFFLAAFICGVVIFGISPSSDWLVMFLSAPFSAAIIAVIGWALFTSFGRHVKIWKGIVVGVLAGSISHFFAWYSSIVFLYLQNAVSSLGEPTVGLTEGIGTSLMMTLFSLVIIGWLTVPIGAFIGAAVAWINGRFLASQLL